MKAKRHFFKSLLLLQLPLRSSGFSAWLPCHRYLEEDEVIMNNKVVAAPSDTDDIVTLAVYDSSGSRVDENSIVWIDGKSINSSQSLTFSIRMDPSTTDRLSDLQFVVETYPFQDKPPSAPSPPNAPSSPNAPTPSVPTAPAPNRVSVINSTTGFTGASKGGGVLCDGKRSHSRGKTGFVTFELAADTLRYIDGDNGEGNILSEVWGGWSENHGKVTLTPKIYFKVRDASTNTNNDEL